MVYLTPTLLPQTYKRRLVLKLSEVDLPADTPTVPALQTAIGGCGVSRSLLSGPKTYVAAAVQQHRYPLLQTTGSLLPYLGCPVPRMCAVMLGCPVPRISTVPKSAYLSSSYPIFVCPLTWWKPPAQYPARSPSPPPSPLRQSPLRLCLSLPGPKDTPSPLHWNIPSGLQSHVALYLHRAATFIYAIFAIENGVRSIYGSRLRLLVQSPKQATLLKPPRPHFANIAPGSGFGTRAD